MVINEYRKIEKIKKIAVITNFSSLFSKAKVRQK